MSVDRTFDIWKKAYKEETMVTWSTGIPEDAEVHMAIDFAERELALDRLTDMNLICVQEKDGEIKYFKPLFREVIDGVKLTKMAPGMEKE